MSNLYKIKGNLLAIRGNLVKLDARKPFIIEVDTTLGNGFNTFTLPLTNHTTNIDVKVSDGQQFNISNYLDTKRTINFATSGVYTIELKGQCGWSFNNTGDCQKLKKIVSWGNFYFNYLVGGFFGCINIGLNGGLPLTGSINAPINQNFTSLFYNCNLTSVGSIDIFKLCIGATNFTRTFFSNQITSIPSVLFDNCAKVTTFTFTFNSNYLTSIPQGLFDNCTKVTTFQETFTYNQITSIPVGLFNNNTLVTTFYRAFAINQITSIPQGLFDNCNLVTSFQETFQQNLLITIPENLFLYNVLSTNYSSTFRNALESGCTMPTVMFDLTQISKVTSWVNMFSQVYVGKSPLGTVQDIWNYASVSSLKTDCFKNCTLLTNYNDIPNEWKQT